MIPSGNGSKTIHNKKNINSASLTEINELADKFNNGDFSESESLAINFTQRYPREGFGWKVLGAIYQKQELINEAHVALKKAAEYLPKDSEAQYNLGNFFYDQGQLEDAVKYYKKSIKLAPGFAKAHYNLGNVYKNQNCLEDAKKSYQRALEIEPNNVHAECNLAQILYEQNLFSKAIIGFEHVLQIQQDFIAALVGLGAAFQATGKFSEAEECFRKAISKKPNDTEIYNNIGNLYKELGRFSEAENCYREALSINPESADTYIKLGLLLKGMGKIDESLSCFTRAVNFDPQREEVVNDLGLALADLGRYSEAEFYYQKALKIAPNYWKAYNNLGLALHSMGRFLEAETAFEKAKELIPNEALVYSNLSLPLVAQGQIRKAQDCLKRAIELAPGYVNAYINLGTNYLAQGMAQEAENAFIQALKYDKNSTKAKSNLLFTLNYSGGHSAAYRLEQACEFGKISDDMVSNVFTTWQYDLKVKRLRIGLVSGDLRQHPVAYFLENWAQHIDTSKVELFAYLTDSREDAVTTRLKPHFSGWKSLVGLSDQSAAQLIHSDSINILVDLSGHTAGNRLPVFAWKPAPIQVSWLGYFATTGMATIDYFIADEVSVPETNKSQFVEKIMYLPHTRLCFTVPEFPIEVTPLPALANGYITFASFQTLAKAGDDVFALWVKILSVLPNARLRWQCKSFEDLVVADNLRQRLVKLGINVNQLILLGSVSREAYFAAHAEVDVILDTFPYSGGTTTCEALWMGVPTLTIAGSTLIARQGASLLTAAGLGDWVAESQEEYVNKALLFTRNLDKLAKLRAGLRQLVLTSPLFNAPRFAKDMESALWKMWNESLYANSHQLSAGVENQISIDNLEDVDERQLLKSTVAIVSATKFSESDFWNKSALGLSLKRHLKQDVRLLVKVAFENTRGLPEIFNQCIDEADDDTVLVFVHDDIWIDEANFADAVIEGLESFDIIGVAGNVRRIPKQAGWSFLEFRDDKLIMDVDENLSGHVAHGKSSFGRVRDYGKVPAECELLDGVFLATKKNRLVQKNVRFDEQFDFHFYDLDFCRSAKKAGLKLGTWLINLTHQSTGTYGNQLWMSKYILYLNKWEKESANDYITILQNACLDRELKLQDATNEVLQIALEHQNSGELEQAKQLYLEVLNMQPQHAEANHELGVLEANQYGALVALPRLEKAVHLKPENEQFWVSYIDALMKSGNTDSAADALELGMQYGLKPETAKILSAEFVRLLESTILSNLGVNSESVVELGPKVLPKIKIENSMQFIIVAPNYTSKSAGIVVLHELCDSLNKLGHRAAIIFMGSGKPEIKNDARFYGPGLQWYSLKDFNELNDFVCNGIVIYPEIIKGNPLRGKRVVRYLLNYEGVVLNNSMEASENDFILAFSALYHKTPHAYLTKFPFNPVFNNENTIATLDRTIDLTYIGKGANYNQCFVVPNTIEVTREWPHTKVDLAKLLRGTRYFFTWDVLSQTNTDAYFCGAIPVLFSPLPLNSFDELGSYPMATGSIVGDEVIVKIPDNFDDILEKVKKNYMETVDSYDSRLVDVLHKMLQYFTN